MRPTARCSRTTSAVSSNRSTNSGSPRSSCRASVMNHNGQGERKLGGFILITGVDGIRYAVRQHAIAVICDADECQDEALIQLAGGRVVRVPHPLDEVLGWFL